MLAVAALGLVLSGPLFIILFCRSTKDFPKTWRELVIEVKMIVCGFRGQNEDMFLMRRNRVKLIAFSSPKVCVITGGNRGIGIEVIKKLLRCNVTIVMGVRNPEGSKKSIDEYLGELAKDKVFYETCDTGDMQSVRDFARNVQSKFPEVHILINNAGVMSTPYKETKDGFESQMAINYLGHFLLTHLLMPQLIAASKNNEGKNARIVNVSSCIHKISDMDYDDFHCTKFYYPVDAYAKSKLAQVYFSKYLDKILTEKGINVQVHAVHPGVVNTDLFEHSSTTYVPWFKDLVYKKPEAGSRTIVYAAISHYLEGKGGEYLSNCYYANSHKKSNNVEETKKLFVYTCGLLNIEKFGDL